MSKKPVMTPTFYRLFPECTTDRDKARRFFQHFYECNSSKNKARLELELAPNTYTRIYNDVINNFMDVHDEILVEFKESVFTFVSPEFIPTLHKRYEKELKELKDKVREYERSAKDPKIESVVAKNKFLSMAGEYRRMYQQLLRDELNAVAKFISTTKERKPQGLKAEEAAVQEQTVDDELTKMADDAFKDKQH